MSQNGQKLFENLAANALQILLQMQFLHILHLLTALLSRFLISV